MVLHRAVPYLIFWSSSTGLFAPSSSECSLKRPTDWRDKRLCARRGDLVVEGETEFVLGGGKGVVLGG